MFLCPPFRSHSFDATGSNEGQTLTKRQRCERRSFTTKDDETTIDHEAPRLQELHSSAWSWLGWKRRLEFGWIWLWKRHWRLEGSSLSFRQQQQQQQKSNNSQRSSGRTQRLRHEPKRYTHVVNYLISNTTGLCVVWNLPASTIHSVATVVAFAFDWDERWKIKTKKKDNNF